MAEYEIEFPFTELKTPTGDYYDNRIEMERAGFVESQMWSVTDADDDDGSEYLCYGPVHHYVNLIGYIATAEHHDGDTYYIECIRTAKEVAAAAAYFCEECDD
jgi:hypothetical protein